MNIIAVDIWGNKRALANKLFTVTLHISAPSMIKISIPSAEYYVYRQ